MTRLENIESVRTGQINNSPLTTSERSTIVAPSLTDGEVDIFVDRFGVHLEFGRHFEISRLATNCLP
jgi:hypothetical protein